MKNIDELKSQLLSIILNNSNNDNIDISYGEGKNLIKDLEYDSITFVNLMIEIEAELGFEFEDLETLIDKMDDLDGLIDYICELIR